MIYHTSLISSQNKTSFSQICIKIKTHILLSRVFFFENRDIYKIRCKNIVDRSRTQMTVWRMRIACWIPKARNTHSDCVILIAFPLQQWMHKRAPLLRYTYMSCLVDNCVTLHIYRNNKVANVCAT